MMLRSKPADPPARIAVIHISLRMDTSVESRNTVARITGVLSYLLRIQLCPDHIRAENYGKKSYPIL